MQGRGLIDKEPDPQDARGCILHLTDDGFRMLEEADPHHVVSVGACSVWLARTVPAG
ncbi:MarR family winged helix-turn-helix transcriptional regulator [Micromonospora sp. CB01531]|uniref:MarR family winged helix-turn-helix transcriptional regulator n=2 Tax=unclassified Micromonospora TaxID=2617518 RepID=UPI0018E97626|nr:MarR family winged helix-turn-helix transcriptional regulator [Micromonospora sp. CB01531]